MVRAIVKMQDFGDARFCDCTDARCCVSTQSRRDDIGETCVDISSQGNCIKMRIVQPILGGTDKLCLSVFFSSLSLYEFKQTRTIPIPVQDIQEQVCPCRPVQSELYFMGTISALLFSARPSSVSLGAIGFLYPKPTIETRDSLIPLSIK